MSSIDGGPLHCPRCGDLEWIEAEASDLPPGAQPGMMPCPDCYGRRRALRLQAMCGLNDQERRTTFQQITTAGDGTRKMIAAAQRFVEQPRGYLVIHGGSGNAKTLALQAIVNALLARNTEAIYTTFFDLMEWVKDANSPAVAESAGARIKQLQSVKVLAIDECDLSKSPRSDYVHAVETQLFDARYRDGLAGLCGTVLAMNGEPEQFSPHLRSRLRDGRNVVIENSDPDMRALMR